MNRTTRKNKTRYPTVVIYVFAALTALTALTALAGCGGGGEGSGNTLNASSGGTSNSLTTAGTGPTSGPAVTTIAVSPSASPQLHNGLVTQVVPSTYAAGTSTKGAWDVLISQRSACGFGLLQQDSRLDAAAASHARYLVENSISQRRWVVGHNEIKLGNEFFTGETPDDRVKAQGFPFYTFELLAELSFGYADTINFPIVDNEALGANQMYGLIGTVYHGRGVFSNGLRGGVGTDFASGSTNTPGQRATKFALIGELSSEPDMMVQKLGAGKIASYPCNGLTGVRSTFSPATESPNPFPDVVESSVLYGTPIYFKADPGSNLLIYSATITRDSTGVNVDYRQISSGNDHALMITFNEVFLVPTSQLAVNETYTVNASGTLDGKLISKTFTFKTEEISAKLIKLL